MTRWGNRTKDVLTCATVVSNYTFIFLKSFYNEGWSTLSLASLAVGLHFVDHNGSIEQDASLSARPAIHMGLSSPLDSTTIFGGLEVNY
jgi:hypothetical protein